MYETLRSYRQIESALMVPTQPWWLAGAAVDMDFSNGRYYGGTLSELMATSRASTGYATNGDGTLTLFGNDTPRIGIGSGLLVEEARTNFAINNQSFGISDTIFNSIIAAPTFTTNFTTAPDGTTTATRLVFPAFSGAVGEASKFYQLLNGTANVASCNSIYLKGSVGGEIVDLIAYDGSAYSFTRCTLTTSWQRFSRSFTAVGVPYLQLGYDGAANPTAAPGCTIFAWGTQAEQTGLFPTSLIPTIGVAVTRAADVITAPGIFAAYRTPASSVVAYVKRGNTGQALSVFTVDNATANERFQWIDSADGINYRASAEDDGGTFAINNNFGAATTGVDKLGVAINTNDVVAYLNGVQGLSTALSGIPIPKSSLTTARIGVSFANNSPFLNGYIPRLAYFATRVPNVTLSGFTS